MSASVRLFDIVRTRRASPLILQLGCPVLGIGPHTVQPGRALLHCRSLSTFKILSPSHRSVLNEDDHRIVKKTSWSFKTGCICRTFVGQSGIKFKKNVFTEEKPGSDAEENLVKGDKTMKLNLNSTRLDAVLKAGLQISKNKIEKMFFADRIRINGARPKKKSQTMREGDEIDIIHKPNELNPDFIDVSRIEIVQLGEELEEDDEDMIEVKGDDDEDYRIPAVLKRYKRLTVENYKQKWKGPVE